MVSGKRAMYGRTARSRATDQRLALPRFERGGVTGFGDRVPAPTGATATLE